MDTIQAERPAGRLASHLPFRLREVSFATQEGLAACAAEAAAASFDAIVMPCPFHCENGVPADAARAADCYGGGPIQTIAPLFHRIGAQTGIALIVDLPVGVAAANSPLHRMAPESFVAVDEAGRLDPRLPLDLARVRVRLSSQADIDAYGDTLASVLSGLVSTGVAGFRLLGLSALTGAVVARLAGRVRRDIGGAVLIGDTQGLAWDELAAIGPGLLDYTVASSAWWNCRDGWFYEELDRLRRVAPALVPASSAQPPAGVGGGREADRIARDLGLAASLGAGWILPASVTLAAVATSVATLNAGFDTAQASACIAAVGLVHLNGVHGPVLATLRTPQPDARAGTRAFLALLNIDPSGSAAIDPAVFLPALGGVFEPFRAATGETLVPGRPLTMAPGGFALFVAGARPAPARTPLDAGEIGAWARARGRLAIEAPRPAVDGGAFAVKRTAGELVAVSCDVICDGHDKLGAVLQWRGPGDEAWTESRLVALGNDRWQGAFPLMVVGLHHYRFVAWRDAFATFRDELAKKHAAGVPISLELREGAELVSRTLAADPDGVETLAALERASTEDERRSLFLADATEAAMRGADPRPFATTSEAIPVDAERTGAGFAAWYEVFPRSMSDDATRHGTFRDVQRHLPRIRAMGFDVLYFPPIHPIGKTNRKGPNNTLTPGETDPGSPYAIGAADGGHTALHAELGTLDDFLHLRDAAIAQGLELAIDFAIQCSPDHPWLREHKDWFTWRPDGTIRYAENPPKKYQDIVNVDFYAEGAIPGLWVELANTVLYWCEQGVRLFRVDNPHTKAFAFWQWMIQAVRVRYPDAVFLAEAFTRPKIMARLAKVGFSQSYTYFTWRNDKAEIAAYLTELADGPLRDFFRPHFFVNTPDINPGFLQHNGRPAFLIRAALAATLSGLWGVYNGFELCEGTPLAPGKEEYLDSEKFQLRAWDWDRPGNIVAEITRLNQIRRANPALQTHLGVTFLNAANDAVLFYEKATPDRGNVLLIAVSIDPVNVQTAPIELPLYKAGLPDQASLDLEDLLEGQHFTLAGKYQTVTLTPDRPYAIWRLT